MKLSLIILPPLLALVGISSLLMNQATRTMGEANSLVHQIETSEKEAVLIQRLQKERGMSCVFLSSNEKYCKNWIRI